MTIPTANPVPSQAPVDLLFNAEKIDEFMNSDDEEYIDRFGRTKRTRSALESEYPNAQANADAAAESANVAAASAGATEVAKDLALAAQANAELARDAAAVNGKVYPTTTAGLAATSGTGDANRYFSVPSADTVEYLVLYRNDNGIAVAQKRYPSAAVDFDSVALSSKNIYNPLTDIISGYMYLAGGGQQFNAAYRVTKRYPIVAGQPVSISGLGGTKASSAPYMHFWNGSTFVSSVALPASAALTDYITEIAPIGANSFSLNLNGAALPDKLQIELAAAPTQYQPARLLAVGLAKADIDAYQYTTSAKNLYDGGVLPRYNLLNTGLQLASSDNSAVTGFIPVTNGKTYTISGLDPALAMSTTLRRIIGFSTDRVIAPNGAVKAFAPWSGSTATITIDDANVKFIVVQLSIQGAGGNIAAARALKVQVEEGIATPYEPRRLPIVLIPVISELASARAALAANSQGVAALRPQALVSFEEIGKANPDMPALTTRQFEKNLGPHGLSYGLSGDDATEAASNNLYASITGLAPGVRKVYARLANYVADVITLPKLDVMPFSVPSGMLDNAPSLPFQGTGFPNDNYCHPSIAYSAAGVGGYKYWMVSSILPAYGTSGLIWEDEDIFVSNDAKNWLRVRSLYEADKAYTAPTLRLPPNDFATDARRNGFLPMPGVGEVLEISTPADNGRAATDRVSVTVETGPWKHDPAILIDGGYVYVYHTFHIPQGGEAGGKHRFVVCTRTSDGVNWETVRGDGSTLAMDTPAAARQLFTKDSSGRYNFMYYAYNRSNSNPEVIKYGEGDYELLYGNNFGRRYKGTAPWAFDFANPHPMQDLGSGNHPGAVYVAPNLYQANSSGFYVSANRGVSWTKYAHAPYWLGGASGYQYKKAMCVGEAGKIVLVEVKRNNGVAFVPTAENTFASRSVWHKMMITEFPSMAAMDALAGNLVDGYIDVQIEQVNYAASTRKSLLFPYVGNKSTAATVHNPHQKVLLGEVTVTEGDRLFFLVTLVSRSGALIRFNGLAIE